MVGFSETWVFKGLVVSGGVSVRMMQPLSHDAIRSRNFTLNYSDQSVLDA